MSATIKAYKYLHNAKSLSAFIAPLTNLLYETPTTSAAFYGAARIPSTLQSTALYVETETLLTAIRDLNPSTENLGKAPPKIFEKIEKIDYLIKVQAIKNAIKEVISIDGTGEIVIKKPKSMQEHLRLLLIEPKVKRIPVNAKAMGGFGSGGTVELTTYEPLSNAQNLKGLLSTCDILIAHIKQILKTQVAATSPAAA